MGKLWHEGGYVLDRLPVTQDEEEEAQSLRHEQYRRLGVGTYCAWDEECATVRRRWIREARRKHASRTAQLPAPCSGQVPRPHSHYYKDVRHLDHVDVYRVLDLFSVTDPCLQHAVKKLLVAGGRGGGKDITQDIKEAVASLTRWQAMREEDSRNDLD